MSILAVNLSSVLIASEEINKTLSASWQTDQLKRVCLIAFAAVLSFPSHHPIFPVTCGSSSVYSATMKTDQRYSLYQIIIWELHTLFFSLSDHVCIYKFCQFYSTKYLAFISPLEFSAPPTLIGKLWNKWWIRDKCICDPNMNMKIWNFILVFIYICCQSKRSIDRT